MRKLALAVLVVAAAALVVGGHWVLGAARYDDIESGGLQWAGPDGYMSDIQRRPGKSYPGGQLTQIGVSVSNAGSRDVRLTRVGDEPGTLMSRYSLPRVDEKLAPFAELTLHPGEDHYFVINLRLTPCSKVEPGTDVVVGTVDVRFRVLVFDHQQRIALSQPVRFTRGKRCG